MAEFYRLVATPSFKKYGGSGPLVVELGPAIDPPPFNLPANTYPLQLAEPTVATAEAPLPDGRQFWSFTGSETWMMLSAAEPGVAVGFVATQYYENNFQAIACPPANFPELQGYWLIDQAGADYPESHALSNPQLPASNYCLAVYNADISAGTLIVLFPYYSGSLTSNSFFYSEPFVPDWWYLETKGGNEQGVTGNFVIGFTGGAAAAGDEPTMQPMQAGALSELWTFYPDGTIRTALDATLAITAPSSAGAVTVQPVLSPSDGGPTSAQVWTLGSGGALLNAATGSNLALTVQNAKAATGVSVITNAPTSGGNETWTFVPYEPEPSGLYFSINTALDAPAPMMLTANLDGSVVLDSAGEDAYAQPILNQLWQITLDGHVVSALNPSLGLTAPAPGDGNSVTVAALRSGAMTQRWTWDHGTGDALPQGVLVNLGDSAERGPGQCLTVQGATITPGTAVVIDTGPGRDGTPTAQQLWSVQPAGPPYGKWTPIRSTVEVQLDDEISTPLDLVLTVQVSDDAPPQNDSLTYFLQQSAVIAARRGDPAAIWRFSSDGYIFSSVNPQLVLSLAVETSSTIDDPAYGTDVVVALRPTGGAHPRYDCQLWVTTGDGIIYNRQNGLVLTVNGTYDAKNPKPVPVITSALASEPGPEQVWDIGPGKGLQSVLAQPGQPFPAPQGDAAAYQYVDKQLGLTRTTLRQQYSNLAAPLASYQLALATMAAGPYQNWDAIVAQLSNELTAAIAVQSLFQQIGSLHVNLGLQQAMGLEQLITALEVSDKTIPKQTQRRSWIWDIVDGVVYTALNVAGAWAGDPEAGSQFERGSKQLGHCASALANVMQTGFTATQAGLGARSGDPFWMSALQNVDQYLMTAADLQQALLEAFEESGIYMGKMESLLLTDWGRLQRVYEMICTPAGTSSLAWSPRMGPMEANQLLKGYMVQVLQILMPLNSSFTITGQVIDGPANLRRDQLGLQPDGLTYVVETQDLRQSVYTAAGSTEVMSMLWANGASPYNYFHGEDGWSIPTTYKDPGDGAYCFFTILNWTPEWMALYVTAPGTLGAGGSTQSDKNSDVWRPLAPFGIQTFGGGGVFDGGEFYLYTGSPASGIQVANMRVSQPDYNWAWNVITPASGYNIAFSPPEYGSRSTTNMVTVWVTVAPPTG